MKRTAVAVFGLWLIPSVASAQAASAPAAADHQNVTPAGAATGTEERLRALEARVKSLEGEVQTLRAALEATGANAAAPSPQPTTAAQAEVPAAAAATAPQVVTAPAGTQAGGAALPVYGQTSVSALAKVLNPDISAIGDFIGVAGKNTINPIPSLEMHESELGFQAIVDPYARADFFLSFGERGVNLEEGYITFTSLPAGFIARVGKMRAAFGKVNTLHNHVLPWIDRPLVTNNLVGGEDGIDDAGISVNRAFAAPGDTYLELTGQVFRGDSAGVFTAGRRRDVSTVSHLRAFKDITEATNLDFGLSYARGYNIFGNGFTTQLYGTDLTYRWKPLRRAIYHSFIERTEVIWSRRQQPNFFGPFTFVASGGTPSDLAPGTLFTDTLPGTQNSFGFYTAPEYRINRRWTAGGRWDYSERQENAHALDRGYSAVLTYWPSEFSQIRGQYRLTRYAERINANELLLQFQFSLGAHGAHPF